MNKSFISFLVCLLVVSLVGGQARADAPVNIDAPLPSRSGTQPVPEAELVQAAATGNLPRVKELIQRGADINVRNNAGMTALMWASANGRTDIVRYLLQNRANTGLTNRSGYTALMIARRNHREDVIPLLAQARPVVSSPSRGSSGLAGSFIRLIALLGVFLLRYTKKKNAEKKKADSPPVQAASALPVQSPDGAVLQKKMQQHIVTAVLRLTGAVFIVGGVACYYDLGGISTITGLNDPQMRMIFSGIVFALGIFNYLILPPLLDKRVNP